ncbi:MAG TPA: hypothetical protein VH277_12930 [Gemmatimonadaceae bacterium]|jgi:hypothetical protein|nr:hypothetical protein [Gemmatimonadaceae bacterium]
MSEIDFNSRIDWNTELRAIEREFDGLPPETSEAEAKAQRRAERRARERTEERVAIVGTHARVLLVAALLGAINWWPYTSSCGGGLAAFVGAQCMVVVGGMWCAVCSWRNRLAVSHAVALALLATGLTLVASQVLSRLGYVSIAGLQATRWRCG